MPLKETGSFKPGASGSILQPSLLGFKMSEGTDQHLMDELWPVTPLIVILDTHREYSNCLLLNEMMHFWIKFAKQQIDVVLKQQHYVRGKLILKSN